ncbi:hypothetical protein [Acaryochloris marina]|uniref:Uncharacterized protein n=1 Tax=Acaryochloris marina (strain MBIC 11017) TaxID=329726 RepID=A8ZLH4_ACAM1|nr:hypothetical protein [Acaryochloris marina]ABW32001.1 hypothetical protein AM1_B0282 [Acaryochloris marina MBIC11017]BDM82819.1 hypothetical protein AM10699_56800 [Acaryochloris marina MBIC10699]
MINSFLNALYLADLNGTKSLELSDDHIKFWETARRYVVGGDTLGSSNLVSKTVEAPVNLLFVIGIIGVSVVLINRLGFKTAKDGPVAVVLDAAPQFFWVILAVFLLASQFVRAYDIANTTWAFRNNMRNNTKSVVHANQVFTEAIANEFFNVQFGQEVSDQLAICQGLPFPTVRVPQAVRPTGAEGVKLEEGQTYDFLDCLTTLEETIKRNQAQLKQQCGAKLQSCEIVEAKADGLARQVGDGTKKIRRRLIADLGPGSNPGFDQIGGIPDPLLIQDDFSAIGDLVASALSGIGDFLYMGLVEFGNTLYTSSIEILFLLGGMFFPITVAWSVIPGKRQVLLDWFVTMLSLIITEQVYLIIIGMVAVLSSQPQFHEFGPKLFLFTLGITAPLIAAASGGVSGFQMARTYRGTAIGAAGAALSVISGVAFSIAYKANSKRQLAR